VVVAAVLAAELDGIAVGDRVLAIGGRRVERGLALLPAQSQSHRLNARRASLSRGLNQIKQILRPH
jgi:hypothetical protein